MTRQYISFSIPLSGTTLEFSKILSKDIHKNFSLKFMSYKKSRPHINLFSGYVNNLDKVINLVKKNLNSNFDLNIKLLGFGAFLTKQPTIYIRFENTPFLKNLRKIIFETSKNWKKIDNTVYETMWIPKSTIVYKDMGIDILGQVTNFINLKSMPKKMLIKEIIILNISNAEEELDKIILKK